MDAAIAFGSEEQLQEEIGKQYERGDTAFEGIALALLRALDEAPSSFSADRLVLILDILVHDERQPHLHAFYKQCKRILPVLPLPDVQRIVDFMHSHWEFMWRRHGDSVQTRRVSCFHMLEMLSGVQCRLSRANSRHHDLSMRLLALSSKLLGWQSYDFVSHKVLQSELYAPYTKILGPSHPYVTMHDVVHLLLSPAAGPQEKAVGVSSFASSLNSLLTVLHDRHLQDQPVEPVARGLLSWEPVDMTATYFSGSEGLLDSPESRAVVLLDCGLMTSFVLSSCASWATGDLQTALSDALQRIVISPMMPAYLRGKTWDYLEAWQRRSTDVFLRPAPRPFAEEDLSASAAAPHGSVRRGLTPHSSSWTAVMSAVVIPSVKTRKFSEHPALLSVPPFPSPTERLRRHREDREQLEDPAVIINCLKDMLDTHDMSNDWLAKIKFDPTSTQYVNLKHVFQQP